jgi:DNA-binding NtrC family response regulator
MKTEEDARRTILIVEDNPGTAELEKRVLTRVGLTVRIATRVNEAVALIHGQSFLVVLLDFQLPDSPDPWPVVDAANGASPPVPVVLVTGQGNEQVAADAIRHGVHEYVKKSENFYDQLPDIVNRVSHLAQTQRALQTKVEELEKMNRIMLGREERILELKEELAQLRAEMGKWTSSKAGNRP